MIFKVFLHSIGLQYPIFNKQLQGFVSIFRRKKACLTVISAHI